MRLPPFTYLEPASVQEALGFLSKHRSKARILAGGTEIVPLLRKRLVTPQFIISLKALKALRGVQKKGGFIEVGSLTTLEDLSADPFIRARWPGIYEAARAVAAPPVQNVATLGGNILQNTRCLYYNQSPLVLGGLKPCFKRGGGLCHAVPGGKRCFSVYQGDVAPALIALSSEAEVMAGTTQGFRAVEKLFSGKGKAPLALKNNEIISRVRIPIPKGSSGSAYEKLRLRGAIDYALVSCAAFVAKGKDGRIGNSRVVLGACGAAPRILEETARILTGSAGDADAVNQACEAAAKNVEMVNNTGMPADYRRRMVPVIVRRAIERALAAMRKDG
jgi:4-hydroxybenzoyl-CoA reductase subunit beta